MIDCLFVVDIDWHLLSITINNSGSTRVWRTIIKTTTIVVQRMLPLWNYVCNISSPSIILVKSIFSRWVHHSSLMLRRDTRDFSTWTLDPTWSHFLYECSWITFTNDISVPLRGKLSCKVESSLKPMIINNFLIIFVTDTVPVTTKESRLSRFAVGNNMHIAFLFSPRFGTYVARSKSDYLFIMLACIMISLPKFEPHVLVSYFLGATIVKEFP